LIWARLVVCSEAWPWGHGGLLPAYRRAPVMSAFTCRGTGVAPDRQLQGIPGRASAGLPLWRCRSGQVWRDV